MSIFQCFLKSKGLKMIIAVLNQKGGSGKTTLSVNLARAYTKRNIKTILIDTDNQGSAQKWHERCNGELIDMTCISIKTLDKDIVKYTYMYDRIIIDGIPQISPITIAAIKCADLILIPVQPSPYDIWATGDLIRNVKDRISFSKGYVKAYFVVSRKITGTNLAKEIEEELENYELPVLKNGTSQRVAYPTSVDKGLTVLDGEFYGTEACKEIEKIINEIEETNTSYAQKNNSGGLEDGVY
jgi:chromosome partitioning protein